MDVHKPISRLLSSSSLRLPLECPISLDHLHEHLLVVPFAIAVTNANTRSFTAIFLDVPIDNEEVGLIQNTS